MPLLTIRDLSVTFATRAGRVRAVDGVSLEVHRGQTLAIVGESGSGKSVTALSVLRLLPRTARVERGRVDFAGRNLLELSDREMLGVRGGRIAMIFQEPMTCLNPVQTVGEQIIEAVRLHLRVSRRNARVAAIEAMGDVGLDTPDRRMHDYPHQLSGGMQQRVMIAMALVCRPTLLLADEPTTALDVTVQTQILKLLRRLQREREMAVVLITHDLDLVADVADSVGVMYRGRLVEHGTTDDLLRRPAHPYTHALTACRPRLGERRTRLLTVEEVLGDPSARSSAAGTR